MSGDNYDFCEYVYNPLMRQYQAMMRLMSMLRDSQSDCNDIQCFTPNDPSNPNVNPFSAVGANSTAASSSFFANFIPVLFIWALFVFALFMFRPASMRASSSRETDKAKLKAANSHVDARRFFRDDHDDDNSSVS